MKITNWLSKLERSSRSRRRRVLASVAAAGVAGAGALAQADTTTTLTGLPGGAPFNLPIPQTHGDNAEVDLTWNGTWNQYGTGDYAGGWNGRGNVYQMEYTFQSITFDPTAPQAQVTINEFYFDEWAGGGNTSSTWAVTTPNGTVLASGLWNLKDNANDPGDDGGRDLISVNAVGRPNQTLTLSFANLDSFSGGGFDSYLAMDNLVFSTTIVPEPATAVLAWLGVGGLGAMAMRRKRN